jgi:hypothetical protein
MRSILRRGLPLLLILSSAPAIAGDAPAASWRGLNIAVSCFPLSPRAAPAVRALQARLEEILAENGVTVLDEATAAELRQGYHLLADPTAVVTAELLLELREKYRVDRLLNLYCDSDVAEGVAEFFTATAHAELRLLDPGARVEARSSRPMGVVGHPGSDAVTAGAARLNALERAMDDAATALGLKLSTPAEPRLVRMTLEAAASPAAAVFAPLAPAAQPGLAGAAALSRQTWEQEKVSFTALSPDGNYGVVATYRWSQRMGSRRIYGSRLHVIDAKARRPVATHDFSPLAISAPHEKHGKEVLAAAFLGGWRFLVAVNANEIVLWDVERGRELSRLVQSGGGGAVELAVSKGAAGAFVRVRVGRAEQVYRLAVAR